jgi:hypothetical protein
VLSTQQISIFADKVALSFALKEVSFCFFLSFSFGTDKMQSLDHDQETTPLDPKNSPQCFKIHPSLRSAPK